MKVWNPGLVWMAMLSASILARCSGTPLKEESILLMAERARYADDIVVPPEFAKCGLEQKVAKSVRHAAKKGYEKIITKPVVQPSMARRVLVLNISNVSGIDRALYDQRALTVRGVIYDSGQELTSFEARRRTSRRPLQIKSTCSMLDESIEEIEDDLKTWFQKPTPNARLGDLKP